MSEGQCTDPRWPGIYQDTLDVFEKNFSYRPASGSPSEMLVRSTAMTVLSQLQITEALVLPMVLCVSTTGSPDLHSFT